MPDQMVQEMLLTLGIAMFCVNSSPAERPTMKEVVALLMEVKEFTCRNGGKLHNL
ncbi:putative non-specific serine/threonine protein kinase [Helianthus annuus]|nr:putative non-specific serine/threonine protein kinase [Helianthus annuus]